MSAVAAALRALFPNPGPRAPARPTRTTRWLPQLFAVACALVPLAAMQQAYQLTA